MNSSFRLKLFFIMTIFALVLLFSVAYNDYLRLKNETIKNHNLQLTQTEEEVAYILQTIDKAFYLFDRETVKIT